MTMKKIIILSIIFALVCIGITGATINVSVMDKGDSFITWNWDNSGVTNVSVDGYNILLIDTTQQNFTLSDLKPLEQHSIKVRSASDSGTNITSTTSNGTTSFDAVWKNLDIYFLFILGIICLAIAALNNELRILGLGGLIFASLTCMVSVGNSTIMLVLGLLLAFASIYITFNKED